MTLAARRAQTQRVAAVRTRLWSLGARLCSPQQAVDDGQEVQIEWREHLDWHDGVEVVDPVAQTWRGYIDDHDNHKHLTAEVFEDKGDAVIAAGKMLAEARKGNPPA